MVLLWFLLGAFGFGIASGGSAAWWVQGVRLDSLRNEYAKFKNDTEALEKQAELDKKATEAADKLKKEKTDAAQKSALDGLRADNKRLRDKYSGSSLVPGAPATSSRPDLACFDRAEFDTAIRTYEGGVTGLLEKGSEAAVNLNIARSWAQPEKPK